MEDLIQSELDVAEEYILTQIFSSIDNVKLTGLAGILFTQLSKGKNFENFINEQLQKLEFYARCFMTENGYVNGNALTEALTTKAPILKGCINLPTLKPIEYAKMLDEFINFQALGHIIRSF